MPLFGVAIVAALAVQGSMKLAVDQFVHAPTETTALLELTTSIPFSSLAFETDGSGFAARYRVTLQLLDRRGDPVVGDVWLKSVSAGSYETTRSSDSLAPGTFEVRIPTSAVRGRVDVADLGSERAAWAAFGLARVAPGPPVRLLKSGRANPGRTYSLADTVEAVVLLPAGSLRPDSVVFLLGQAGRDVFRRAGPVVDSGDAGAGALRLPVADSAGEPVLSAGTHTLQARGYAADSVVLRTAPVSFEVEMPFYYADEAWRKKVEQLVYVASMDETRRLKAVPRPARAAAWDSFWRPKDPVPSTSVNEREAEYFQRVDYADEHFGGADRGYRSDRGRVYVEYGVPDQVDARPFDIDRPAQEVWYYYGRGLVFVFVDRFGWGEFVLTSPGAQGGR